MKKKVISLTVVADKQLVALCEDGTVYIYTANEEETKYEWFKLPDITEATRVAP